MKIKQINKFLTNNQHLLTLEGKLTNRTLKYWKDDEPTTILKDSILPTVRFHCDNNILLFKKGEVIDYNVRKMQKKRTFNQILPIEVHADFIIGKKKINDNYKLVKTDTKENPIWEVDCDSSKILLSIKYNILFLIDQKELTNQNTLYAISLETGRVLWSYILTKKYDWNSGSESEYRGQFHKILGVFKNKLWVVLNSGIIQIMDINNGKLLNELIHANNQNNILPIEKGFERVNIFNCFSINDAEGKIFGMRSTCFWEIDTLKKEFILYDCSKTCIEHIMELDKIAGFEGDEVYFYDGGSNNKFGIFSRNKKEIIWSSEISETKGLFPAIRDMQYANNKFFVLDHFNTLHVFERKDLIKENIL